MMHNTYTNPRRETVRLASQSTRPDFSITFDNEAYDSALRVIEAFAAVALHVELRWHDDVYPLVTGTVAILRVDEDNDVVVCEVEDGLPLLHSTIAVPYSSLAGVHVL